MNRTMERGRDGLARYKMKPESLVDRAYQETDSTRTERKDD